MVRALDELVIVGVATNQAFQRRLLADPAFRAGDIDIQFLDRRPDLRRAAAVSSLLTWRVADRRGGGCGARTPRAAAAETAASIAWLDAARRDELR